MNIRRLRRLFILIIILSTSASAQEQPHRTWIGFGARFTKSTAEEAGPVIAGARLDAAYDLRHQLQVRGFGEYRKRLAVPKLFTGDEYIKATSELGYGAGLFYHVRREGRVQPFVAGGVSVVRHFFDLNPSTFPVGYVLYNSSINPTIVVGAGLGGSNEITFTKYLKDTYSYSSLRGWGGDYGHTRKLAGRLHLRAGEEYGL